MNAAQSIGNPVQQPAAILRCGRFALPLASPVIMGVVNVTPDSFSDGGQFSDSSSAIAHAKRLIAEGAALIDIGGESTRPGAQPVTVDQELGRILPVIDALRDAAVPISVDTSKPEVMREALLHGADMINDVCGFRALGALQTMAASNAALCIMYMQGEPRTMQHAPHYDDVVAEVSGFLLQRARAAQAAGIAAERLVIDPGFGFGKTQEHNVRLFAELRRIAALGFPLLVGLSRKSMLGRITGREVDERVYASVVAAVIAVMRGANIVRVHDVGATQDALRVLSALEDATAQ